MIRLVWLIRPFSINICRIDVTNERPVWARRRYSKVDFVLLTVRVAAPCNPLFKGNYSSRPMAGGMF